LQQGSLSEAFAMSLDQLSLPIKKISPQIFAARNLPRSQLGQSCQARHDPQVVYLFFRHSIVNFNALKKPPGGGFFLGNL
jgi:hypothetical protein